MKNKQLKQIVEDYNLNITCKAQNWVISAIIDDKGNKVTFEEKNLKVAVYLFLSQHGKNLDKYTWLHSDTMEFFRTLYYIKLQEV